MKARFAFQAFQECIVRHHLKYCFKQRYYVQKKLKESQICVSSTQHGNSSSEFIVLSWLGNALQSGHVITENMVLQRAKNDWGLRPTTICYLLPIHQLMYLSSTNVQWMLMFKPLIDCRENEFPFDESLNHKSHIPKIMQLTTSLFYFNFILKNFGLLEWWG